MSHRLGSHGHENDLNQLGIYHLSLSNLKRIQLQHDDRLRSSESKNHTHIRVLNFGLRNSKAVPWALILTILGWSCMVMVIPNSTTSGLKLKNVIDSML
jgi:hypothetical protein